VWVGCGRRSSCFRVKWGCVMPGVASCPWVNQPYFGLKVEAL
jgi:hypothetical protein